jgi:hypothetical protein
MNIWTIIKTSSFSKEFVKTEVVACYDNEERAGRDLRMFQAATALDLRDKITYNYYMSRLE